MQLFSRNDWEKNKPQDMGATNCPLCNEKQNVIHETTYWKIVRNKYPILGLQDHLMALPKEHIILAKDVNTEAYKDYREVETFMHHYFDNKNYFTFMRESIWGRSLEHLHYHFLPWQIWYKDLEHMLEKQWF